MAADHEASKERMLFLTSAEISSQAASASGSAVVANSVAASV